MKENQKKHIIDIMKDDEELGLYEDTPKRLSDSISYIIDAGFEPIKKQDKFNGINYLKKK